LREREFGGYEPRTFFRGGHVIIESGVRRMSIFLDHDILTYFAKKAAEKNLSPRDVINDILRKEKVRLEMETPPR